MSDDIATANDELDIEDLEAAVGGTITTRKQGRDQQETAPALP